MTRHIVVTAIASCFGWIAAHSAPVAAELITFTSTGRPYCNTAQSDLDGDGCGWESRGLCIVRGSLQDPTREPEQCTAEQAELGQCTITVEPQNSAPSFQPSAESQVPVIDTVKSTPGGTPYCTPLAIDPDEDGFGWENNRTCLVRFSPKDPLRGKVQGCTIQATTIPYCTQEQQGWGFERGRACVSYSYCPANRKHDAVDQRKFRNVLAQKKVHNSARAVYDFMRSIHGQYIISGQMDKAELDSYDMARRVFDETGKWPALMGYDFMNYTRPGKTHSVPGGRAQVEEAIAYWRRGGLVTFLWHWRDPLERNDHFYTHSTEARIPIDKYGRLDRKNPIVAAMDADLAVIAKGLRQLQDAGVAVLWRPLHEASGGWFWWGRARADGVAAAYAQVVLWRYLYTELTDRYGLNNLIWVWNGQHPGWYPGDDYVDMVGYDSYPTEASNDSQIGLFKKSFHMATYPKMVAMTENGNLPDPDMLDADGANWMWFMTWNDFSPVGVTRKTNFWSGEYYNTYEHKRHVYNHSRVLTLEDVRHIDFNTPARD